MDEPVMVNHIIGVARTIRTAVMVVEYLRERHSAKSFRPNQISYRFQNPTPENGFWSAEIIIKAAQSIDDKEISEVIHICRAFVAGAGEVWA